MLRDSDWSTLATVRTSLVEYKGNFDRCIVRIRTENGHINIGKIIKRKVLLDKAYDGFNALEIAEKIMTKVGGDRGDVTTCIVKLREAFKK